MGTNTNNDRCLNCYSPMPDGARYCPNCGQKQAGPHDHSVWHLSVEAVGDFFHLDSKFFSTLRPLIFQPGFLTTEYLAGRKARYFHPFKLFLFLSFLYFLTTGFLEHRNKDVYNSVDNPVPGINDTATGSKGHENYKLIIGKDYSAEINIPVDSLKKMVRKYGLNRYVKMKFPTVSAIERYMIKKFLINQMEGTISETMDKTIPKLVFVLILFFAFLLKLLYLKKRIPYYGHVIFSLHFLSFFFLLFLIKELLSLLSWWFNPVLVVWLLVYLFLALRRVYPMKTWATVGRYSLFLIGSFFTLLIFIVIATSISFMLI
jgi:hypothetical protein